MNKNLFKLALALVLAFSSGVLATQVIFDKSYGGIPGPQVIPGPKGDRGFDAIDNILETFKEDAI